MFRSTQKTLFTLVVILCMLLITTSTASAQVWTDQKDYAPGTTVTISGGNDENGAPGYMPGAPVNVAISGRHDPAYESTTCESVLVGEGGAWSCTVTLWSNAEWALGPYIYTATSVRQDGSPIEETGTFTDWRTIDSATLTAAGVTAPPGQITVSGGATVAANVAGRTGQICGWVYKNWQWIYICAGNNDWRSTAWAIKALPDGADLNQFVNDVAGLIQLVGPEAWTCVDHLNHNENGTYQEAFNITAPTTADIYTVFFIAYANDTCTFAVDPSPSSPYWLANSMMVLAKASGLVSITNIPSSAVYGGSFIPTFFKLGDGATSVASLTTSTCTVTEGVVSYVGLGTCTLQASVAEGTNHLAAAGLQQSFVIDKALGSVNVNNIPASAVYGGNFTPTFEKQGDGATSVASLTTGTCTVTLGIVDYIGAGTCTLQASIAEGTNYLAATGSQQSFTIAKAAGSVNINNIPTSAVYGGSFIPMFDKLGDGATSVASLTPTTCAVSSGIVSFVGVGTCTLQASIAAGTNYLAATGPQQSFTISYQFIGFFSPVDKLPTLNIAKAGQAIPLKFRLLDYSGNPVTNLTSVSVTVTSLSCTAGITADAIEEYAAGASGLQNLGDGYYQWNWKTPTAYANSCRTLKLNVGDGAEYTALFQFKK